MKEKRFHRPLTLAEELHVLLLDRERGGLVNINDRNMRYAFAGAVLMDLAKEHRIDTDLDYLTVVDAAPVGDDILDPLLAVISKAEVQADTVYWIERFSAPEIANQVRRRAAARLIDRGIVTRDPGGTIFVAEQVSRTRRYPGVALPEGQDVALRVMNIIFSEDIPTPDETMLIALVDACRIFERMLSKSELVERRERIALVRGLDLLGRSVRDAILTIRKPAAEDELLRRAFLDQATQTRRRPPMAPGALPLIGHSLRLRPLPAKPLAEYYRSLGPVFRVRDLVGELTVLAGPEANRFSQKHGRSLFRSHGTYTPFFESMDAQRIILSMDGEEHFKLRKAISSGFSGDRFLARLPAIRDIVLGELPENGRTVAIEAFSRLTAKSIGLACTGHLMSDSEVGDLDFFLRRMIASRVIRALPRFMARTRQARRAKAGFFDIFDGMLRARLDEEGGRDGEGDVVDVMLELHRANPQFLPEHELRVSCLGPIFSGLHTTASTGTSAMYLLLKHPDVLERVREEADALFANEGPDPEKMNALDVTRRTVLETLRMYNPFGSVFRHAVNTFDFGGFTIAAGTRLFLPIAAPHHSHEFFPNPGRYLPERAEHRQPGVYMPFGFGTHRCLGSAIADAHLMFALATILHHLDVEMDPPDYEMKMAFYGLPAATKRFRLKCARRRPMAENGLEGGLPRPGSS